MSESLNEKIKKVKELLRKLDVVVTRLDISVDANKVFAMTKSNPLLINRINSKAKELENRGGEVFHQVNNIIATDSGYYCAFFAKDLEKVADKWSGEDE